MANYTLYQVLGISSSASQEEIKTAFKVLAKKYHPDKNAGSDWHAEQFKQINQAYQLLSDVTKRNRYDAQLHYQTQQHSQKNTVPKKPTNSSKRPPPSTNKIKQKDSSWKIYLFVSLFFIAIGVAGYFLYHFMNQYTAKDIYAKAEIASQKGRHKEAFMLYTDAISFYPNYSEAYEKRGIARILSIGDYKGASRDFTNAIIYSSIPNANLYFQRAKCFIKTQNYPLALLDIDSIIKLDKSIDSAYFYKAEINYYIENYKQSIPDFTTFISKHPTSADAYIKRGYCYYKTGFYNEALVDFNYLISIDPKNGEAFYYRGVTNYTLKENERACLDFQYASLNGFEEADIAFKKFCKN